MATRKVFGYIRKIDDTPWADADVTFTLTTSTYISERAYPKDSKKVKTAINGYFEITLWCNEEGEIPAVYEVTLPDNTRFKISIPAGETDANIGVLRSAYTAPPPPPDNSFENRLTEVENDLSVHIPLVASTTNLGHVRPDGTTIMAASGVLSVPRRGVLYVTDYGAVGDGAANDTTAIQAAVEAVPAAGGVVYLPPGTYRLAGTVLLKSNVHLRGAGRGVTILRLASEAKAPLVGNDEAAAVSNVRVSHLTIDGNRAQQTMTGDGNAMGIRAGGWVDSAIEDVDIRNCATDGLYITGAGSGNTTPTNNLHCARVTIQNSRRNNLSVICGTSLTFAACDFDNANGTAPQAGADLERNSASQPLNNIRFSGCRFRDNVSHGLMAYEAYGHQSGANIIVDDDCVFRNNGGWGIRVYSLSDVYEWHRVLAGGLFDGNTSGGIQLSRVIRGVIEKFVVAGGAYGVQLLNATTQVVIDGGVFRNNTTANIDIGTGVIETRLGAALRLDGGTLTNNGTRTTFAGRYYATHTTDIGSLAAGASTTFTVSVPGAATGHDCRALPVASLAAGIVWNAWVSAADTVTVRLTNITGGALDPDGTGTTWHVYVAPIRL